MIVPDTQIGWVVRKKIIEAIRYGNCRKFASRCSCGDDRHFCDMKIEMLGRFCATE
jgi:hypothetical protein